MASDIERQAVLLTLPQSTAFVAGWDVPTLQHEIEGILTTALQGQGVIAATAAASIVAKAVTSPILNRIQQRAYQHSFTEPSINIHTFRIMRQDGSKSNGFLAVPSRVAVDELIPVAFH